MKKEARNKVLYVEDFPETVYRDLRDYWQANKRRGGKWHSMSELIAEVVRAGLAQKRLEKREKNTEITCSIAAG